MMELKDFIYSVTTDIIEAISELKEKYNKKVEVNNFEPNPVAPRQATNKDVSHTIDFDILVTTSENATGKAGGKVGISVLGANLNGEAGYSSENSSRLKFSIPFFPEFIDKKQS